MTQEIFDSRVTRWAAALASHSAPWVGDDEIKSVRRGERLINSSYCDGNHIGATRKTRVADIDVLADDVRIGTGSSA